MLVMVAALYSIMASIQQVHVHVNACISIALTLLLYTLISLMTL